MRHKILIKRLPLERMVVRIDVSYHQSGDGKWYDWSGPEASDVSATLAEPDTIRYKFATLVLTELWRSIETNTPLALDEGTHHLRVRYKPMGIRLESEGGLQKIVPVVWVTSNLLTFNIIEQPLTTFGGIRP